MDKNKNEIQENEKFYNGINENIFESISDYIEKGSRPKNDRFIIGKTPLVLQITESNFTEVTIPTSVIKKAVETHNLSKKEIFDSIYKLYNPVLIFDSDKNATENKIESKLILTDVFKDEKPIALAVNINTDIKLKDSNISVEVQDIRSIHDRTVISKNGTDLIKKWTENGLCRYVDDKKIANWCSLARVQFPIEQHQLAENNILTKSNIVNGTDYQKIQTFSEFAEQQKNMEKEYQEEKEDLTVATYKFQSGETLEELLKSDNDFPSENALLDNLIDGNIRAVYRYATEEEQKVLRQFAAFRNDYDIDMKNLAVQTNCISRWIAAEHWNPEKQEFQKEYVNQGAIKDFPYKLPWEMKRIEEAALKSESKEKAINFVVSKLKSAGIEVISDKSEFESTLAELKSNDEIIQRMTESFEKSEKLRPNNNSVLRANEDIRNILTEALDKTAEPLKEVVYSWENYVKIFGDGVIQSPVETIKMGKNQFVRLCPPDRNNLMGAIYETMTKPSIVLEKETFDEKSESFKPVHVYGKSFINQDNDHKRAVESIIVFKDGQNIAASLHNKTISALVKQIKTTDDIIYLDKEVSRVAMFDLKDGYSHVVKETEKFLSSAGQKSLPLWNKSYDTGKILSISDLIAKGEIEGGKLEITKDNFDKYFNIFNQNIRAYKDKPNKIAGDLFSFYVRPENKLEMKQWLESQGYKINENQRSEKTVLSEYTVSDGTTYGFAYNGKIYLNPDFTDSNVAVHEYTHLWDEYTKNTNPQLWEKGKDIFKATHIWQEVKSDPNYADIADNDDLVLSEVHARICGKMAQEVLERIAREDGEIVKDRAIDWNKEVNEYLFSEHGLFAKENLENERLFIEEFMSLPVKDLFKEKRGINLSSPSHDELGNYLVTLGKVDEETIPQVAEKSINEEKIKMPDQLVYAAAKVGQVIEQRVQNELGIVNPTRADRLSTISVPLNKEYNEDFALSTVKKLLETEKNMQNAAESELQQTEPGLQKKFDQLKEVLKSREEQDSQEIASTEEPKNKMRPRKSKSDIIRQAGKDLLEGVKKGIAPFFNTEDDFQRIIMHPQAIINASNGLPFSGESQLLAQIYHKQHEMEGEIVTSIAGAKAAGTIVLNTKESLEKNFALTDTSLLAEKNTVVRTRYFMPESCEEPDKIYAHTLQQQRPDKIRSYRDLIRHFENIPNGQKEITDIRIRIAHEHLKEIQSRFAIKEERTLSVDEIEERKNFLRNYFERLPADYRDTERSAFEDTFGIQLNSEKNLEINLQRKFKDIDFDELKKNTKKSIELENRKLSNFIEKNTMDNKKLASLFSNEYKALAEEEKMTARNLKIEALGIKEPETFLGKYLAACNTNAEFITDKETVEEVKKNLVKKLEENFKLEKYDILKEIGQQAQSISNETTKQISFEKAHSNNKSLGKTLSPDKEISLIGMGK